MTKKIIRLTIIILAVLFLCLSNTYAETSETENLIPVLTSNTEPTGEASSSTIWSNRHQPYNAFNQSNDDYGWVTAEGEKTGWLSYEFEQPKVVNKYIIKKRTKHMKVSEEIPKDWTFEGWNGDEWLVLDEQTNVTNWEDSKEFSFNNTDEFKKYRLNVTDNNGYKFTSIGALEMYNQEQNNTEPTPDPQNPEIKEGTKLYVGNESLYKLSSGDIYAWGNNQYGQLGLGDMQNRDISSREKVDLPEKIIDLVIGKNFVIALGESGKVYGWGDNTSELYDDNGGLILSPVEFDEDIQSIIKAE
ncbi:hypothetical protein Pryu01_01240 [Paraliobacillus ryukyuensis]|uniref:Regulator of chromosome condensation (RCC1) repeat-containing protein n=1 Tax=Paraliobacillus ryukyuensis TaxID=200904 RepID=A0A366EAY4_9BACI|nr:RCC1 repeat-containing protein [Paraliobacillus ryukyuensis]RBO99526.1 regulator of chromosome condensation (RCC1) repeat-containing protein [Paraliobacillus ryukyuensis]